MYIGGTHLSYFLLKYKWFKVVFFLRWCWWNGFSLKWVGYVLGMPMKSIKAAEILLYLGEIIDN